MKHTNNTKNTCSILTVMRFVMLFVLLVAMLLPAQMTLASTTTNAAGPLPTSPSWTAESNQTNSEFGNSVSATGDVNGDGYGDVIVGARYYDNGEENEGKVFVYYGSASGLSATPNWTAESNQSGAELGYSVGTAGDVNDDGYADVIVGAHRYQNGQPEEGAVFVWYGSANGLGDNGTTAGDVNGDGYDDVIVGAAAFDNGTIDSGKAYVFHGSASGLSVTPNWTAVGDVIYRSYYGTAVSTTGDVNGDGYDDVMVGAHNCTNPPGNGKAYVYYGSISGLSTLPNWKAVGSQTPDCFGDSASTAGDVNGDGYADIIVGAGAYDKIPGNDTNEGRAYVFFGSASGLSCGGNCAAVNPDAVANWKITGDQTGGFLHYVGAAGDVNSDGYGDVVAGSRFYDVITGTQTLTDAGKIDIYYGSAAGLIITPTWTIKGDQAYAEFGVGIGTAGDVNGDGYADIIAAARLYDAGETDEGRVFVYYGNTLIPSTDLVATTTGTEIYPNDLVSVDLNIQGASDLYAAQALCTVDPAILESQSGTFDGSFFDPVNRLVGANVVSSTLGTWLGAISQANPAGPLSGDGLFATVTYEALSPGTTAITCDPLLSDRDGFTQTVSFTGADVTVLAFGTINGTATYQGRLDHTGIEVTATGLVTSTDTTDGAGSFTLGQLKADTYDVKADADRYLPVCTSVSVTPGEVVTLDATTLLGGDVNDDDVINIGDAALLGSNFGLDVPPGDAAADINADGLVNVQDLAILGGNYEVSGCQAW